MHSRYASLALFGGLAVGLVGCAPPAEPDWAAAESAAQKFERVASGQDGFLGSGSLRVDSDDSQSSGENEVVLSYAEDVRVEGAIVACFGEGSARLGLAVRVGSSWLGAQSTEVECDGAEHSIDLDEPFDGVDAVTLSGARTDGGGGMLVAVMSGVGSPGELAP